MNRKRKTVPMPQVSSLPEKVADLVVAEAPEPQPEPSKIVEKAPEARTFKIITDAGNGFHVPVRVFSGPDADHLQSAGSLVLTPEDVNALSVALFEVSTASPFVTVLFEHHDVRAAS